MMDSETGGSGLGTSAYGASKRSLARNDTTTSTANDVAAAIA